jgi:antitoxin component YwqK of YwqJK toxin-antitoxin module
MNRTFLILLLTFITITFCKSQKVDTLYLNKYGYPVSFKEYKFYMTIEKVENVFNVVKYNKKGHIIMNGCYKDALLYQGTGPFYHYNSYRNFIEIYEPSKYINSFPKYQELMKIIPAKSDSFIIYIDFYNNDQVRLIGYANKHWLGFGTWLMFCRNGNLSYKYNLKNGIFDGEYCSLLFPDTLKIGQYKNGKKIGEWKYYNRNGEIKKKVIYHDKL